MPKPSAAVEKIARMINPHAWSFHDEALKPFVEQRGAQNEEAWIYFVTWERGCRTPQDVNQWLYDDKIDNAQSTAHSLIGLRHSITVARSIREEFEKEEKDLLEDKARLDYLQHESNDLRCHDIATGADDCEIGWRVISHHMGTPSEKIEGENFNDNLRAAIDEARKPLQTNRQGKD